MSGPEALPVGLGLADSRGSGTRSSKVAGRTIRFG